MTIKRRYERLLALLRQDRLDCELDDEVLAHLELAEHDALARGLDPAEARRDALRQFGGIAQMKERHRDDRSVRWIENLLKDVQHGLATCGREPGFTVVAIGILALGIGGNAAMFSVVDGVVLRPLPFSDPERIVRMWEATPAGTNSTALNFIEINRRLRTFEAFSAEADINATAEIHSEPSRLAGRVVSWNHFAVFGVPPFMGRAFREHEDRPGANHVIVLRHAAWRQRFGADPAILSRDVRLDGVAHRVIGVMPPGVFDRDRRRARMDVVSFWKPIGLTSEQLAAGSHWLSPVGRLKVGMTLADAQRDMLEARAGIDDLIPQWKRNWSVTVEPFEAVLVNDRLRQSLYIALGAVALSVLLIACANLTNLLLSRGAARQKEIAVRAALGASRLRLVTQMLTESLVLGILGGAGSIALAAVLIRAAVPLLPVDLPFTADISLNVRVLAFAAAVTITVSALVGILPALRLSAASAAAALQSATRGSSGQHDRIRRSIVAAEVAISIVLISGAVLLFKSLARLQQVEIGARVENVMTASVDIARDAYPTPDHAIGFYTRLVDQVQAIPGVQSAAVAADVPLEGTGGENLRLPGRDEPRLSIRFKRAGTGYFETLGIPLLAGRSFTNADRLGSPWVTVINEALAAQLDSTFGMKNPLGQIVDLPAIGYGSPTTRQRMTIVGIVKNERVQSDLRANILGIGYVPLAQAPLLWTKLAVRTTGDPASIVASLRDALRQVDPRVALAQVRTLEELRALSLSGLREPAWLIGAFAALSALLAALGLYGVVAHTVAQRRREIGIRMALGARSGHVLSALVQHVMTTVAIGLAVGLAGAYALTRVTKSLLFEVSPLDPVAFAAAAVGMIAIGTIGALVPARHATRVDPTTALRSEG